MSCLKILHNYFLNQMKTFFNTSDLEWSDFSHCFVLMQYLIVFKQNYYHIVKTEASNDNLELNQQLAKNCTSISQMVLILYATILYKSDYSKIYNYNMTPIWIIERLVHYHRNGMDENYETLPPCQKHFRDDF